MAEKRKKKKYFSLLTSHFSLLFFLLVTSVAGGFIVNHSLQVPDIQVHNAPDFEVYPREQIWPRRPTGEPKPVILPKVAIIIDDIGYDRALADKFLNLDVPVTFSALPYSPFQKTIVNRAGAKGIDIMLHLPMEPIEYPRVNPGPGALLTSMTPAQIINQLHKNLDNVPFIVGVNNHMGSKMTANSIQMYQVLSVLKQRGLFFIDSFTTVESLSRSCARSLQIPFAQRDVFLDHFQDPAFVRKQIKLLISIANTYGEAIGIGHPYPVTYEAIRQALPELRKKVKLVPASEVVHTIG
ncbi:MAG: divergent polysaccharide deacetylase family protein [Desulfobacterales bacterium]|nr:divergent polysaccharide deacetylase family protein [Desulfobacterales bacterium]